MDTYPVHYMEEKTTDGTIPLAVFPQSVPDGDASAGQVLCYTDEGMHVEVDLDYVKGLKSAPQGKYEAFHDFLSDQYAHGPAEPLELTEVSREDAFALLC